MNVGDILLNYVARPVWPHEYRHAGMVLACRWCGEIEAGFTGCPVSNAVRFVSRKIDSLYAGRVANS